uniref:G-protein coupled receptor 54-like n=1 Tax=Saccoglossus kowalevskii TaxID=10224 RepID=A0ABM0LVV4_SACKO|nr:PREDICTED: G-protein coupled receptor 54-like [Saccoglossus kowalevskii]
MTSVEDVLSNYTDISENGTSNSPYYYYEGDPPVRVETWLVPLIFGTICLIGIVGNALVIVVILKNKQMRTVTNYYILNLAISDVAYLTCAVPFSATSHVSEWVFGEFMCKFSFYAIQVTVQATCITLTAMSVDRYYAIVHPLKSLKTRTPKVAISAIAAIWLCLKHDIRSVRASNSGLQEISSTLSVYDFLNPGDSSCMVAVPVAIYKKIVYFEWYGVRPFCFDVFPTLQWDFGWYVYTFIAVYALPICIITICYSKMLRQLWNQVTPGEESAHHTQSIKQKKKITKMVFMVTLLFFICWMPIHIQTIWTRVDTESYHATENVYYYHLFANCLSYANSCLNPFIYAFMGENFRKCFRKVFAKWFKKHSATVAAVGQGQGGVVGSNLGTSSMLAQKQGDGTLETSSRT